MRLRLRVSALAAWSVVANAHADDTAFKPLRYNDEPRSYIELGDDAYVSIGGEIREQYERYRYLDFGQATPFDNNGYLLQRYMLHASLHLGARVRVFGQLKSNFVSFAQSPTGPADEDHLDVHQAFVDLGRVALVLRVGRQEMLYGSQRLIGVREGPNVRRAFDVARVLSRVAGWRLDGFVGWPVETDPGVFDDWRDQAATLWGVYATGSNIDLYYLGLDRPEATFDQGTAHETRHSVGMRLFSDDEALDYDIELIYQWGRFGAAALRAWTIASDTGYTLSTHASPRIALRANVTSGDDGANDDLGTFNALYPRGNYFGESAVLGPSNLIDFHPMLQLRFFEDVTFEAGWTWYWRESTRDGVYSAGVTLVRGSGGSEERYIGSEVSLLATWQVNGSLTLSSAYSHFYSGPFVKDTGPGRDVDYVNAFVTYQF